MRGPGPRGPGAGPRHARAPRAAGGAHARRARGGAAPRAGARGLPRLLPPHRHRPRPHAHAGRGGRRRPARRGRPPQPRAAGGRAAARAARHRRARQRVRRGGPRRASRPARRGGRASAWGTGPEAARCGPGRLVLADAPARARARCSASSRPASPRAGGPRGCAWWRCGSPGCRRSTWRRRCGRARSRSPPGCRSRLRGQERCDDPARRPHARPRGRPRRHGRRGRGAGGRCARRSRCWSTGSPAPSSTRCPTAGSTPPSRRCAARAS